MATPAAPPFDLTDRDRRRQRRALQMQAWRRRSALIGRLRRVLPLTVAGVLLVLTGWVLVKGWISRMGDSHPGGAAIHMTNAHFLGRDGAGRAFMLGAVEASRGADQHLFTMVKPTLEFTADDARHSQISANQGVYRDDTHILSLTDHVVLTDSAGDRFSTNQAMVDTEKMVVTGWNGVQGDGPRGRITAQAFGVYDHGARIVFSGEVHTVFKAK